MAPRVTPSSYSSPTTPTISRHGACGVGLEDGSQIEARVVASSVDAHVTFERLLSPSALPEQLQASDPDWHFTDAEMMTAAGHLETHGYVAVLRSSAGEQHILLAPELLVTLASSIVFLAPS